jgi:pimeloyl-ACP methyl ester carboxylesterase
MPIRRINDINLSFETYGTGETVLLIPGTDARGTIFKAHQVPALLAAGFRAVTVDNRGVAPSDLCEQGFTLADLVADAAGLIEHLGCGPCRVAGFSMGALVVQELLLARPDLVSRAVLMATRGRTDPLGAAHLEGELELLDRGTKLPARYAATTRVYQGFAAQTLADEETVRNWLDLFEMSIESSTPSRAQLLLDRIPDRRDAYRAITVPTMVLAFGGDLLTPPHLGREVADAIPGSEFRVVGGCGHFGFVEQADDVNSALIDFFSS